MIPLTVRLIIGGISGAVIGAMVVVRTILKARWLAGAVHPPGSPWALLPWIGIFIFAGLLAGWLYGLRSRWARFPAIGAVVGAAGGIFLAVSHPYTSLIQPRPWTAGQVTAACAAAGMVIGAAAAAVESLRSQRA